MVGAKTDGKRYADFLGALREHDLVVVQRDVPGTFMRDGYVGIFTFKDLVVGESGDVKLTLVARYADPK